MSIGKIGWIVTTSTLGFGIWVAMLVYLFKTLACRRPGVRLWRDAPARNPFNHIFVSRHLTEEGLRCRRRLILATAAFVFYVLAFLGVGTVVGALK